jgi:hypothetical protein
METGITTHRRTDTAAPTGRDASETIGGTGHRRLALWRSGPARDILLVLLGAGLAVAAEDWRDTRQRRARVAAALNGIAVELSEDSVRVMAARERHLRIVDTLDTFAKRRALPPREVYLYGMFNPAPVSSVAWHAARETGALGDMPLTLVLGLARAYEAQERYRALGEALNVRIMDDVRHDGMDVVLRDRFTQFIPLATDFANREANLLNHYRRALAMLTEIP